MKVDALATLLEPDPKHLDVEIREVSRLADCGPNQRWNAPVKAAIDEALTLSVPRARFVPAPDEGWDELFVARTPVEPIVRGGAATLFAATIGTAIEARVADYFARANFLEGVLLDAAGSALVEALCDWVEATISAADSGRPSTRFSPGYCSWPMEGQRRLFSLLQPETIGIKLLPSMLMRPLKSVTGAVVIGDRDELAVPAEECRSCDAKGCIRRRAPKDKREK